MGTENDFFVGADGGLTTLGEHTSYELQQAAQEKLAGTTSCRDVLFPGSRARSWHVIKLTVVFQHG